ncbi:hypothetical protein U1Q18_016519 [Sarracenia purpurea var. burkii]
MSSCLIRTAAMEASSVVGAVSQHQSRQDSSTITTSSKSRVIIKKPSSKPVAGLSSDAMVKAAAVAAGARIATPSDAASLLKAAQSKNAVHIIPGGGSLVKSSVTGNTSALPPNVHFFRTGLATTPLSTYPAVPTTVSRPSGTQPAQNSSPMVQLNSTRTSSETNPSAELTNAVTSSPAVDFKANDTTNSDSYNHPKDQFHEDQMANSGRLGTAPKREVQEAQASVSGDASNEKVQEDHDSGSGHSTKEHIQDQAPALCNALNEQCQDRTALPSSEAVLEGQFNSVENPKCLSSSKTTGDQSAIEKTCENPSPDGKQVDLLGTV